MKYIIFIMCLSGCSFTIDVKYINWAVEICEPHGGLIRLSTERYEAFCADGISIKTP